MVKKDINLIQRYNKPFASQKNISKQWLFLILGILLVIAIAAVLIFLWYGKGKDLSEERTKINNEIDSIRNEYVQTIRELEIAGCSTPAQFAAVVERLKMYENADLGFNSAKNSMDGVVGKVILDIASLGRYGSEQVVEPTRLSLSGTQIFITAYVYPNTNYDTLKVLRDYTDAFNSKTYTAMVDGKEQKYKVVAEWDSAIQYNATDGRATVNMTFEYVPIVGAVA